ncbi:MAG TPA: cupin domain-containing protein [Candidatus Sumerlaeota bacterium]|nr:MAG: 5-nitrosalicylic acid 1,2-dioxygenase [candidate division BRC1 bacterium ADurb.BinA292]HOE95751.1 cupin domain-containing protein [Candidatus Sumerlaeota bacterium]HOR26518.1 cupin domain-containing protein [Candidatus Sumerlaeota bacterium]
MMEQPVYSAQAMEAARKDEAWGSLRWLASGRIGNAEGLTLGRVLIRKGAENPRHCHPNCEELLYLMRGRLEHTLGDETYTLEAGDTLRIPKGVFHNARSTGDEDADMIVAYDSADRQFVLEQP